MAKHLDLVLVTRTLVLPLYLCLIKFIAFDLITLDALVVCKNPSFGFINYRPAICTLHFAILGHYYGQSVFLVIYLIHFDFILLHGRVYR